jgi:hypothetical protein
VPGPSASHRSLRHSEMRPNLLMVLGPNIAACSECLSMKKKNYSVLVRLGRYRPVSRGVRSSQNMRALDSLALTMFVLIPRRADELGGKMADAFKEAVLHPKPPATAAAESSANPRRHAPARRQVVKGP